VPANATNIEELPRRLLLANFDAERIVATPLTLQ
jgi:hypothetical protein